MPAPDAVYRFEVTAEAAGQAINNYIDWRLAPLPLSVSEAEMDAILSFLAARWRANILPLMPEDYLVNAYYLREVTDAQVTAVGPPIEYKLIYGDSRVLVPSTPDDGDVVGDYLPTYSAVSVWKITPASGRNSRGSMRLGPVPEANTLGNLLTDAARAAYQTALDTVFDGGTAGTIDFISVVFGGLQLAQDTAPTPSPDDYAYPIDHVQVQPAVGTQLSRKRRLG